MALAAASGGTSLGAQGLKALAAGASSTANMVVTAVKELAKNQELLLEHIAQKMPCKQVSKVLLFQVTQRQPATGAIENRYSPGSSPIGQR